jgi:hypothetical protein
MAALFANLALYRRSWGPLIFAFIWLLGFEFAWQLTFDLNFRWAGPIWGSIPRVSILGPLALLVLVFASWRGVRPNMILMVAVAAVWIAWLATGFHSNYHSLAHLNVTGEVLNEVAKTLWGLAYFLPLLRKPRWWVTAEAYSRPAGSHP